jgi:nucleotide-binding universal stress UspA family protein
MHRLRRIVVGYNFFPDGGIALRSAKMLAEQTGAEVYVLHVVESGPAIGYLGSAAHRPDVVLQEIAFKLQPRLQEVTTILLGSRLRFETHVCIGKPFVELITACRQWAGDLIVVGIGDRRKGHLLGSTAERVVRKALVPVLMAKHPEPAGPKTILVPTDFSACAAQAAKEAVAFVRGFGGRLLFLHVMDTIPIYTSVYGTEMPSLPPLSAEDLASDWQYFLDSLPLSSDLRWDKLTREGPTAQTIVEEAKARHADLLVMGTHGRTGIAHMLVGSVTEEVARTTECSLLTVRPDAFRFELP